MFKELTWTSYNLGYLSTDDRLKGNDTTCDSNFLTFPGYNLEVEKNSTKARVVMFVKNEIKYKRIQNIEGVDSHLLVIGLYGVPNR